MKIPVKTEDFIEMKKSVAKLKIVIEKKYKEHEGLVDGINKINNILNNK